MDYLNHNLEGLRHTCTALAAAVKDASGGVLLLKESREGSVSAMCEGQWIHSAYDPRKEAKAWAKAQLREWQAGEVAVVLGVGLLYHVEALAAVKGGIMSGPDRYCGCSNCRWNRIPMVRRPCSVPWIGFYQVRRKLWSWGLVATR